MRSLLILLVLISSVHAQTLTVFAASSLTDAFTKLSETFEARHPDTDIVLSFGSSSTLATQIEQGATPDVFASADVQNVERVATNEDIIIFAKNTLVVFVNARADIFNEDEIDDPLDHSLGNLALNDYALVLADESVPAGKYARQVLKNLEVLYGEGYYEKVLRRLVSNEPNARQVLTKVGLEADVGIVYASDAASFATRYGYTLTIPDDYNVIADYGMAVLAESSASQLAQQFVDFVLSEAGQAVLQQHGFLPR
jgi:molybdate transport system substrate-binding protein